MSSRATLIISKALKMKAPLETSGVMRVRKEIATESVPVPREGKSIQGLILYEKKNISGCKTSLYQLTLKTEMFTLFSSSRYISESIQSWLEEE